MVGGNGKLVLHHQTLSMIPGLLGRGYDKLVGE